jgi:hypothetical protein
MLKIRSAAAFAAALAVAAQPCLAADDIRNIGFTEQRMAAFAGATLRVPLGTERAPRPSLRLQLTPSYQLRDPASGAVRSLRPEGVELGLAAGRPSFFVAGQPARGIERRMNVGGSTGTTLLIVGGVVVAVVLVAALSIPPGAGPPEGAFE